MMKKTDKFFSVSEYRGNEVRCMSIEKAAFLLRLEKSILDQIGFYANQEKRSVNNYILLVLIQHIDAKRKEEASKTGSHAG